MLVSAKLPAWVMSVINRALVDGVLPQIDHAVAASVEPFTVPEIMRPDGGGKRYGMVHYGIFIPGLPEPFRYCNIMTLLGATGTLMMDNDYLLRDPPSDTATFLCSTAEGDDHHYQAYSIANDCRREEGDVLVAFGEHLTITGCFPDYQVEVAYEDFRLTLAIRCTNTVSWFVRNVAYDHFSLLAFCSGTLTRNGQTLEIQDHPCTFEYARSASPYALTRRVIHQRDQVRGAVFDQRHDLCDAFRVGDLVAAMHPVVDQAATEAVNVARDLRRQRHVAHADLGGVEGQRVIGGGDAGGGVALVGLGDGQIDREQHAGARLDVLFHRVAMKIDEAGQQQAPAQIDFVGARRGFGINRRDVAVLDQHRRIDLSVGQHRARADQICFGAHYRTLARSQADR